MSFKRWKAAPLCFDYWLLLTSLVSRESIESCIRKFEFETLSKEHRVASDKEFYEPFIESEATQPHQ